MAKQTDNILYNGEQYDICPKAENVSYGNNGNVKGALDDHDERITTLESWGETNITVGAGRNLYNKNDSEMCLHKCSLNSSVANGVYYNANFDNNWLAKIPVEPGKEYIVYRPDGNFHDVGTTSYLGAQYMFHDAQGNPIMNGTSKFFRWTIEQYTSFYTPTRWNGGDEVIDQCHRRIVAPAGAKWLYLENNRYPTTLMVEEGNNPSEYVEYSDNYVVAINGKPIKADDNRGEKKFDVPLNVYVAGDSIATFDYQSWNTPLLEKFSFKNYRNVARGGATWGLNDNTLWSAILDGSGHRTESGASDVGSNVMLANIYKIVNGVANDGWETPELVIIHAGTNDVSAMLNYSQYHPSVGDADVVFDYGNSDYSTSAFRTLIDNIESAEDPDTIAVPASVKSTVGGMRIAIEALWKHFPRCLVLVTTPIQGAYGNGIIRTIRQQIIKAAAELSVDLLDLYACSNIYLPYQANWLVDTIHPKLEGGGKRLADVLGRYLIAHYGNQMWFTINDA